MPKSRIMIQLEPETVEQVDKIRGAVPRAAWVRLLIEDRLRGESDPLRDLTQQEEGPIRIDLMEALKASIEEHKASVSQQEENRSPKPGDERSNRSRRAGKGRASDASAVSRGIGSSRKSKPKEVMPSAQTRRNSDTGLPVTEGPSAPLVRCICGGIILQDGPKAGKCTKCAKPKEAK